MKSAKNVHVVVKRSLKESRGNLRIRARQFVKDMFPGVKILNVFFCIDGRPSIKDQRENIVLGRKDASFQLLT